MATRTLTVEIIGDTRSLERAFGRSERSAQGFAKSMGRVSKLATAVGGAIGVGLAGALKVGFDELAESQKVSAQTEAVLASTGRAAGVAAKDVENLAGSLSRLSGVDDEAIQSGENLLLTFTKVRNEAGKGNDVFNQATRTMLDMSVALGQDMKSSAIQLGKALNDPIKGVTALQRFGVSFTAAQKEQIKALVESGNTLAAQKLILAELNTEFGGSAKAAGETLPGQLAKAKLAFEAMAGKLAEALLPAFTRFAQVAATAAGWLTEHQGIAQLLAGTLAGLAGVLLTVGAATKVFAAAQAVVRAATVAWTAAQWLLNIALAANPIGIVVVSLAALGAALFVAWQRSETFRSVVTGAWNAVRAAAERVAAFFGDVLGPVLANVMAAIRLGVSAALGVVIAALDKTTGAIEGVIRGFRWLGSNVAGIVAGMRDGIRQPLAAVTAFFRAWWDVLGGILGTVKALIDKIGELADLFKRFGGVIGKAGSLVGGVVGKIPGFAHGGTTAKLEPIIVGEQGPELFVPQVSGTVLPKEVLQRLLAPQRTTAAVSAAFRTQASQAVALARTALGTAADVAQVAAVRAQPQPRVVSPIAVSVTFAGPVFGDKRAVAEQLADEMIAAIKRRRLRGLSFDL